MTRERTGGGTVESQRSSSHDYDDRASTSLSCQNDSRECLSKVLLKPFPPPPLARIILNRKILSEAKVELELHGQETFFLCCSPLGCNGLRDSAALDWMERILHLLSAFGVCPQHDMCSATSSSSMSIYLSSSLRL